MGYGLNKCLYPDIPPYFGTKSRTEVLVMLAVHGPTPARKIASIWGVDTHTAFDWVAKLERSGVVEKRAVGAAYPGLNMTYRLHDNVLELASELAKQFPPPDPNVPAWRAGFSTSRMAKPNALGSEVEYLCGSPIRTGILALAASAGCVTLPGIIECLLLEHFGAGYAVQALIDDGLLVQGRGKKARQFHLNPDVPAADEFRRLLRCATRWHARYRGFRAAARRFMGVRSDRVPAQSRIK
jgi:hypothetical protein